MQNLGTITHPPLHLMEQLVEARTRAHQGDHAVAFENGLWSEALADSRTLAELAQQDLAAARAALERLNRSASTRHALAALDRASSSLLRLTARSLVACGVAMVLWASVTGQNEFRRIRSKSPRRENEVTLNAEA